MMIRYRRLIAALAAGCSLATAQTPPPQDRADPGAKVAALRQRIVGHALDRPVVVAHRGCWRHGPENSITALRACAHLGVDAVEFDVRHSKDGVAVVIHDETVDRTTDGHGKVSDLTLAQLRSLRLRAGSGGMGSALTDERIPELTEFLAEARAKVLLVFDVKDLTQEESFQAAKAAGVEAQAIFFYECANDLLLKHIRSFWKDVIVFPIAFGHGMPLPEVVASCPSNPAGLFHVKFTDEAYLASPASRQATRGATIWINTMFKEDSAGHTDDLALQDPDAHWGRLLRAGANMVMTNEPEALLSYLGSTAGLPHGGR